MPEMPQVEALRGWLAERLPGRVITAIQLADFSALKTYDPPLDALVGLEISAVARHGKFIDIDAQAWLIIRVNIAFPIFRHTWEYIKKRAVRSF